ncbi:MAG: cation:proton antiporter [Candidatus Brocadiales bacterium]|nr:cation:proton antiporter [Candidatus Bathyanammoxibius sp.]
MEVHTLTTEIGIICFILFLSGLLARKLRLSLIPIYILTGLFLGNFVQKSIVTDFLSQIGILLLLFLIGLEFSFGGLLKNGHKLLTAGFYDLAFNLPVGFIVGQALGWDITSSLLLSGIVYISSSAIICKGIVELKRSVYPETECLLGILVFEDIFIAIYLAVLSGVISVGRFEMTPVTIAILKALVFCGGLMFIGKYLRKYVEKLLDVESTELFALLMFSIIILTASAGKMLGLTEAIGAFFAGMVIAETRQKARALELIAPLQYITVAIFFVSFGIITDFTAFGEVFWWALLLVGISIPFKLLTGVFAGRAYELNTRAQIRLGCSLLPRGEFSIVIAAVATTYAGSFSHHIQALTLLYVLILAILGSIVMRFSGQMANAIAGKKIEGQHKEAN